MDFEEVDSLISMLDNKTIRELIMNLEYKSSDKILIAIEWSWKGELFYRQKESLTQK